MRLHTVKHDRPHTLWCGPAALSALTGKPTSECIRTICSALKQPPGSKGLIGVANTDMFYALELLGYETEKVFDWDRSGVQRRRTITLAEFVSRFRDCSDPFLVNTTGHYVVTKGARFVDSYQQRPKLVAKSYRRDSLRVHRAWAIRRMS